MSIYRPRKPSNGKGAPSQFLMFCISVWEMLFNGKFPFQDTNTIKWKCGAAGYSAQWVNPGSSSGGKGGGVGWQSPNKELDPRVAVPANTWVYISTLNPLVTVGIIDADSGLLVTAPPGKWLTLQDVPALISGGTYHMPQLPYPGATGEVSGTPLAGDLDNNPLVYWVLESPAPACFS